MKKLIIFILSIMFLSTASAITIDGTRTDKTFKKVLTSAEYSQQLWKSLYLMWACKETKRPHWCYVLANHTAYHETKWNRASTHNTFGMLIYKNKTFKEEVREFVESFNQYWYKNSCREMVTKSNYTTTQKQAWIYNCRWMEDQLTF